MEVLAVVGAFGSVDILVNNAGIGRACSLDDSTPDDWLTVIGTNLNGSFFCTRAAYPYMKRAGRGHVIMLRSQDVATFVLDILEHPQHDREHYERAYAQHPTVRVGPVGIFAPHPYLLRIWYSAETSSATSKRTCALIHTFTCAQPACSGDKAVDQHAV